MNKFIRVLFLIFFLAMCLLGNGQASFCYEKVLEIDLENMTVTNDLSYSVYVVENTILYQGKFLNGCKGCDNNNECLVVRIKKPQNDNCQSVEIKWAIYNGQGGYHDVNPNENQYFNTYSLPDCTELIQNANRIEIDLSNSNTPHTDFLLCELEGDFSFLAFTLINCEDDTLCEIENQSTQNHQINNTFTSNSFYGNSSVKVDVKRYSDVHLDANGNSYAALAVMPQGSSNSKINIYKNNQLKASLSGTSNSQVTEITTDANGNVYVTGAFKSNQLVVSNSQISEVLQGNCNTPSSTCLSSFVVKFNSSFSAMDWGLVLNSTNTKYPSSGVKASIEDIHILSSNSFVITGTIFDLTNFDPLFTNVSNVSSSKRCLKAFVAKYSSNSGLPKLDWVRTVYSINEAKADVMGFGVTADLSSNIYITGLWKSSSGYENIVVDTDDNANTLPFSTNWQANTKQRGFVAGFSSSGGFKGIAQANTDIPSHENAYSKDIEFHNDKLYTVGLRAVSIYDVNNGVPQHAFTRYEAGNYYEEIAISDQSCGGNSIFTINGGSTGTIRVYNESFEEKNTLSTSAGLFANGKNTNAAMSISVRGGKVLTGYVFNTNNFKPDETSTTSYNYSDLGKADYLIAEYEF